MQTAEESSLAINTMISWLVTRATNGVFGAQKHTTPFVVYTDLPSYVKIKHNNTTTRQFKPNNHFNSLKPLAGSLYGQTHRQS